MLKLLLPLAAGLLFFPPSVVSAQFSGFPQPAGERLDSDVVLQRALKASSLTFEGKPFHAVMEIGTSGTPYSAHIEIWWLAPQKYRLQLISPKFSQTAIVNGAQIQEVDKGEYYPRWLENFVLALLDPIPIARNFSGRKAMVTIGPQIDRSCIRRNDRPGGITDDMTWGEICFGGSDPHLTEVLAMNVDIDYSDWKKFEKKRIARTYSTDVLAYQPVVGHLTVLESLEQPDESMFAVTTPTPPEQRIATAFVSTRTEESMLEKAPDLHWPAVREGKTDGYMIVYARTDRAGQVRESAKHNSDNAELEQYGMEQALKYKFRPLIVDGIPQQMEMPLVLHFTSRIDDPLPLLTANQMKSQTITCDPHELPKGIFAKGTVFAVTLHIDETGKVIEISPRDSMKGIGPAFVSVVPSLEACRFAPYVKDGKITPYKGYVEFIAP